MSPRPDRARTAATAGSGLLRFAALLLAALTGACSTTPQSIDLDRRETSVLWLTVCTLRSDHLGASGYGADVSPRVDILAAHGVFFDSVLTAAPWTRASMASMITGIYPRSLGIEERERDENNRILLDRFDTLAEIFRSAGYATIGITANPNTNRTFNFDQGYDFYSDTGSLWREGYDKEKASGGEVFSTLLEQLSGPFRGKKFFAHLVIVDVHLPYLDEAAREKTGRFEPGGATPAYDRQIRYVDTIVGELMGELARLGRDNLLFVLTSDHGEGFREGRHEDVHHGKYLYNSTIWTPFLLHHPALDDVATHHHRETIASVDMMPTVLDLLGIPWDEEAVQGRSLARAVLDGKAVPDLESGVVETAMKGACKSAVLRDGWKLIVDYGPRDPRRKARRELYRYAEDPLEQRDLAETEAETARDLAQWLKAWQDSCDARLDAAPEEAVVSDGERRALEALGYLRD